MTDKHLLTAAIDAEIFLDAYNVTQITVMPKHRLGGLDLPRGYSIISGNGQYFGETVAECLEQVK